VRHTLLVAAAAACLLVPRPAPAQTFSLGVRAGAMRSQIASGSERRPRNGFTGGLAGRFRLTSRVALQVETVYSQKGWASGETGLLLDYLESPILVRFSAPRWGEGLIVSALAGGSVATEVRCRWRRSVYFNSPPAEASCIGARDKRHDFGFVAALELERRLSPGYGTFEVRYVHGTTNLAPSGSVLRNRSFVLLLGFALDLPPRRRAAA